MEEKYLAVAGQTYTNAVGTLSGVYCGYNESKSKLIIALTLFPSYNSENEEGNTVEETTGWTNIKSSDTLVDETYADNELGYFYVKP